MNMQDFFGLFDDGASTAALYDEITGAIERRFCLMVCMALTPPEARARLINAVCDQTLMDLSKAHGVETAAALLGEDTMRDIVEQHRQTLLKVASKHKESTD